MKRILRVSLICFSLFSFISINNDDFYQKKWIVDQETISRMKVDPGGGG
jgi:hypothetical protein